MRTFTKIKASFAAAAIKKSKFFDKTKKIDN